MGQLFSLPAILHSNHPKKPDVHSYQRSLLWLLKMFTGIALLIPGGLVTELGRTLVSATCIESYHEVGGHNDRKVTHFEPGVTWCYD